jgi:flagellar hook-length control protein FliK
MMPLSLQPAIISVPSDGLPAQPQTKDSESTQALSFGEVLKVEEKKLQQEQETSALSIAALFVTIQPPVVLDSIPRLDSSTDSASTQSNDQTTPTIDSVKSANVSPQQAAPINSKPAAYQGSSPNTDGNILSTNKAGTTATSITDTENPGKKTGVRIAVHAASNQSLPRVDTASIMSGETNTIEKQPSQTTQPEIRIVEKNKTSNLEKVMVEADQAVKNISIKVQPSASETNLPESVTVQTNATGDEVSQSVSKANVSVEAKVTAETESAIQTPIRTVEQKEIASSSTVPPQTNLSSVEMETFLKQRNIQTEAPVSTDNVTAENQPETGNMPKVKGEALVLDQENIPASVKPVDAAQSAEKTSAKETDKKPALDLESTFTSIGTNKSGVDVKAAEKLSANRIDPANMNVIEQITSQVKARIKSGETSISMQLNPGELGKIEVQMTHSAQGVSVSFITEQASTGQLLESQVSQLRQSLKEAGVQLTNLNISQHHQPNQEGGSFKQGQPFVQNPRRDVSQPEESAERMRPQRIGGQTSEIDYLI